MRIINQYDINVRRTHLPLSLNTRWDTANAAAYSAAMSLPGRLAVILYAGLDMVISSGLPQNPWSCPPFPTFYWRTTQTCLRYMKRISNTINIKSISTCKVVPDFYWIRCVLCVLLNNYLNIEFVMTCMAFQHPLQWPPYAIVHVFQLSTLLIRVLVF